VKIHQDAAVYAGLFDGAENATLALALGRKAYVHVARGAVTVGVRRTIHTKGTAANGTAIATSPIGRNMHPKMTEDSAAYTAARSGVMGRSAEASFITGGRNDYFPE
jgi:redox-sensitive bicupin YhaK (pirin superfamily)